MNTEIEREVGAALHSAVDQLAPPQLDLYAIRQAGKRRRARVTIAMVSAAVVIAGGAVTGGIELAGASPPAAVAGHRLPPPATPPKLAAAMANVQAFYRAYPVALKLGKGGLKALIRARVASWYAPVIETPSLGGLNPTDCGYQGGGPAVLRYRPAGLVGGQAVIVGGWSAGPQQASYIVVTAEPGSGKITGITCAGGANSVTRAGARNAVASAYLAYAAARRSGMSPAKALAALTVGGASDASPYLQRLQFAVSQKLVTYDPALCTVAGTPSVSVGAATIVAGGRAGLVVVAPVHGEPIVAVIVLGAKGWTVADIACHQPRDGATKAVG